MEIRRFLCNVKKKNQIFYLISKHFRLSNAKHIHFRGQIYYRHYFLLKLYVLSQIYKETKSLSVGTCCGKYAHSTPILFCDISWFLSFLFFFFPAWVICFPPPLCTVWLIALEAKPSQLRLVTQKKISGYLGQQIQQTFKCLLCASCFH